jgi:hypothetical protein
MHDSLNVKPLDSIMVKKGKVTPKQACVALRGPGG